MQKQDLFSKNIYFILAAVGAAAGLGNLWRFPYVTYENGGGAFIIPYFVCVIFIGLPLLMLEIGAGTWSKKSVAGSVKQVNKRWTWIGWWALANSMVIVFYYAVILAWALQYVFFSFGESWGDDTSDFFTSQVLGLTSSTNEFGTLNLQVILALGAIWLLIFSITRSNTSTLSKVLVFTVPLPLIILAILAINGLNMDGGIEGVKYLLKPDYSKLGSISVWAAAASQVILSLSLGLGQIIGYASRRGDPAGIIKSSISIGLLNSLFSLLAGVAVFATLGYMAHNQGVNITDLKMDGIFLAFSTYPEAISQLPLAPVFGVLFFSMIVLLGIDSAFAVIESNIIGFKDINPQIKKSKLAMLLCMVGFLGGVIFTSGSGLYWLDIVDHWVAYYAVGSIVLLQIAVFGYSDKFVHITKIISSVLIDTYWLRLWKFWILVIIPVVIIILFGTSFVEELRDPYGDYTFGSLLIAGWGSFFLSIFVGILIAKKHNSS